MVRPRFEQVVTRHDELHRHYRGGRLIDFVFALADTWKNRQGAAKGKGSPGDRATNQPQEDFVFHSSSRLDHGVLMTYASIWILS